MHTRSSMTQRPTRGMMLPMIVSEVCAMRGMFPWMVDVSETTTKTHNVGFSAPSQRQDAAQRVYPRLRVLYHRDLDQIGAMTLPGQDLDQGLWCTIGRRGPVFAEPREDGLDRPLRDSAISRKQLRVRWCDEVGCFEVEPVESAKRRLGVLTLGARGGDWADRGLEGVEEVSWRMRIPPGACLAIEDRVLLGLEVVPRAVAQRSERLGFVGESEALWSLREDIEGVAAFQQPALVLGPTGAGKELVARAIHSLSPRASKPFITVNCAALPDHLVESILFGHSKGAFTGADSSQPGHFRAADGGTLFLDELGEMPIAVQSKLLRAVQYGQITPIGHHRTVHVDVRLIAATNRDPLAEIQAGHLREDLYHRLAAHILKAPPLTERRFDIPGLFVHFLRELRGEHPELARLWSNGHVPMAFFAAMMGHTWSGNIRELRNVAVRVARQNLKAARFAWPELVARVPSTPAASPAAARPQRADTSASSPSSAEELHDPAQLNAASVSLDLAKKTVVKLVTPRELHAMWHDAGQAPNDAFAQTLQAHASAHLLSVLERHSFKQRNVAAEISVSPSTLIKLMKRLDLPRATELDLATIEAAIEDAGDDLDLAAKRLKVSSLGLKKRLTLLRLKAR